MARTNEAAVRSVLTTAESAALSTGQITAAIAAATVLVDRISSATCHDATSLELVERYLAADIAVRTAGGGELQEQKIGDASERRNRSLTKQSDYFTTAKMLDCSGELSRFGKTKALFVPLGGAGGFD